MSLLDAPVQRAREEDHGHLCGVRRGLDHDRVLAVVDEREVGPGVGDRGVEAERVVRDVERVVDPVRDLVAGEERGVEDRRRRLADAPADRRDEHAVLDRLPLLEATLGGALADRRVERERGSRLDDRAVEQLREQRHVEDAVGRRRAEARRRLADDRRRAERARGSRRQLGLRHAEGERGRASRSVLTARAGHVQRGRARIEIDAAQRREHTRLVAHLVAHHLPARVPRRAQGVRERRPQRGADLDRVELDADHVLVRRRGEQGRETAHGPPARTRTAARERDGRGKQLRDAGLCPARRRRRDRGLRGNRAQRDLVRSASAARVIARSASSGSKPTPGFAGIAIAAPLGLSTRRASTGACVTSASSAGSASCSG